MGFETDKKVVLVATTYLAWFRDVARSVFSALANRDDVLVCFKMRPTDYPLSVYETIAQEAGADNVRLFNDRFDDLMAACDVLIGGPSTAVMEAILLGRTTICVNFSDEEYRYPYIADRGSLPGRNDNELRQSLDKALSGQAEKELAAGRGYFLDRHMGPSTEGNAAEALTEVICRLLEATGIEAEDTSTN